MQPIDRIYESVEILETQETLGTGWIPDLPDLRDFTEEESDIPQMAATLGISAAASCPPKVDLRKWYTDHPVIEVENQRNLGSCTAQAGVGIVEYYQKRAFGKHLDGSRLFVYKTTRNLLGLVGDTGANVRATMAALALCGVPPEKYWPYTDRKEAGPSGDRTFDDEPPAFIYALADNFEALRYFRHDPVGKKPEEALASVKKWLCYGFPSMFGFYGFPSFDYTNVKGGIPYPCPGERAIWGHAIVAVGYDDGFKIKNTKCNKETTGALLIRNSWGKGWGDGGYGWIPYDYVLKGMLARDFWTLLRMGWVETGKFGL
ncbi:MAG: C1 family peptidase [Synechococcus sp.]